MNKHLSLIIFIIVSFVLILPQKTRASHAMGAQMNYLCLGNNQYLVRYSFFRDCSGIPAPNTIELDISSSCFTNQLIYLPFTNYSPIQISPVCSTATTTCDGGAFTGIEQWDYEGVITLNGPCQDWTLSHTETARNAAITTITGAGSDNLFTYAVINNLNGVCDNSPVFEDLPVPFACIFQQFCYSNYATDIDGDSLTYELIRPRTGPLVTDTVTYLTGYSYLQPLYSNPPLLFNTGSGYMCMTPVQADVTVFAVLVSEFRNGILIGQTERDVQLTINSCNNNPPLVTGINGTTQTALNVCPGIPVQFHLYTMDPDVNNTTTLNWDNGIPAASFITYGTHRDSAFFSWTPTAQDVSPTPYTFTVSVADNNCPYYLVVNRQFHLRVLAENDPVCISMGISEELQVNQLNIFPNPASGLITFRVGTMKNTPMTFRIYNNLGQSVFSSESMQPEKTIDLTGWKQGIYEAEILCEGKRSAGRFVVL